MAYNSYIISGGLRLGHKVSKVMDRGAIELIGPYGFSTALTNAGRSVGSHNEGVNTNYALYTIVGLITFIFRLFALSGVLGDYEATRQQTFFQCPISSPFIGLAIANSCSDLSSSTSSSLAPSFQETSVSPIGPLTYYQHYDNRLLLWQLN